ncbi:MULTISPECIES: DMT family transporter [Streptomyces]|uniref:DMT family transporter n=1 Tax=Streptomyces TaxID=1883 RepID=UPI000A668578|nr:MULTISPECIES: DMT family transporter [unclassified Streptomyces]MCP3767422.1 DMT family transporter [Streptomyces sp. MAR25Y5]
MHRPSDRSGIGRRALLAASVTVFLWATAFVSIRASGDYFDPGPLALGRLLTGSVALLCVLLVKRGGLPPRQAWPGIACSGLLWFGCYMVVLNWGEQKVDAGTAAMVVNIGPMVIALLGGWLLKEGFPPLLLAGMAVSFVGAVVVGISTSGDGSSSVFGVALCLLAALTYGAGVVAQKPALRYATPMQVTTFGCLIGTVVCLPFSGQLVSQVSDAPLSATLNVVYLGLFPTALAFSTWAYALSRTTAGKMGATTYAVPAIVVLISWVALDEVPGWVTLLGGVICLAGVAVSRKRPGEAAKPAPVAAEAGPPASGDEPLPSSTAAR